MDEMNACQIAFCNLALRPDAEIHNTSAGARVYIKRKITGAGELSDGTRTFIVTPCAGWRWLTVTHGWDTIAELDQRSYWDRPDDLARAVLDAIDARTPPAYRTELTPAGEQLCIPGCERQPVAGKPAQLSLF